MNKYLHPFYGYPLTVLELGRAILQIPRWLSLSNQPLPSVTLSSDCFGVNVAPGESEAVDDYTLAALSELGVRHVRLDFSYCAQEARAEEFLERLLAEDYQVLLSVFPPLSAAQKLLEDPAEAQRWRDFLRATFTKYAGRIAHFEIGNTPNRGRWSGFSSRAFVVAWQIAAEEAATYQLCLAGPNVSDFEPLYNAAYLGMFKRLGSIPSLHTDNLFVERVMEPEALDHRAMGRAMRGLTKLNLIKKARVLQQIGADRGSPFLVSSYTCWTIKRLSRRGAWPDIKRVDYLLRYLVLGLSSGALQRVYWGPLICNRDGLVDDQCRDYPEIDQVSFYQRVRGQLEDFSKTPAFDALAHSVRRLQNAQLIAVHHNPAGLSLFRLDDLSNSLNSRYVAWCRDSRALPLAALFQAEDLQRASFEDATGQSIAPPLTVTEHPIFISFDERPVALQWQEQNEAKFLQCRHLSTPELQSIYWQDLQWRGALTLRSDTQATDLSLAERLVPERIIQAPELRVLRDVRNRLWNIADPRGLCQEVTVKLNRVAGLKKLTYRFRPSKGRRHWNNACLMLHRGVRTPTPLAYFERHDSPGNRDSWYLCEFLPEAYSVREVYAAFREGAEQFRGLNKASWLSLIADFVCNMHNMQILHRDLSAGNLLLQDKDGYPQAWLIDIGRARIWEGAGSRLRDRHRFQDLIRIAYKLNWADRELFLAAYEKSLGRKLSSLWRIPFHYYDNKQRFKKSLKGKRRKRTQR
ncbi:hypothetical protein H2508_11460 [Parahaliea sp. F7430]|uniref:Protein kinase domain-containing protein n=1 Tax=Sediminihaliea albiluteola TaxID=2758564 RepID=A0A7W2TXE8_9GAMM|nr:lipopolysaccharide kinase InaA family protein [Sediminihaliea albiluteola]MBA6413727.1 hypothetical protein [Sediminihaliea albiluteola]